MKSLQSQGIKLIKREGMHLVYETPKGILWVGNCTNPNIYVETGYYIETSRYMDKAYSARAYKTAREAILNAVKAYNKAN